MTFKEFQAQYNISLNEQQSTAVQSVEGATLLLAVPGSGKTTTLITRLGYMILGCGIKPESILTMTYTVAATKDMRSRFASLFGTELAERIQFRTINGVCALILKYYEKVTKRTSFTLVSNEKAHAKIVAKILYQVHGTYPQDSDIKAAMLGISYAKNQMLSQNQIAGLENEIEIKDFLKVYTEYNKYLRRVQEMDYDDQMVYAHTILRRFPEVLSFFQERFRYVCVDEAQDTSKIQHEIISILSEKYNNLFMVGDEDQSIYGFRAAYPKALLQFNERYPDSKTLLLEQNYRSSAQIIDVANKFISVNENRIQKTIIPTRDKAEPVRNIKVKDRQDQYTKLLSVAKDCNRETAVLYRDNDSAVPLIDLLERQNIPYQAKQMESSFFAHRTVRDVIDVITLYYDPYNWQAFINVYYKFDILIRKAHLLSIQAENKKAPVFEALCSSRIITQPQREKIKQFFSQLAELKHSKSGEAFVVHIYEGMHYKQYLKRMKMNSGKVDILKLIGKFEKDGKALLERLDALYKIISSPPKYPNAKFILSTIHSSKGLEYDRVYIMDVMDGIFPKDDQGLTGDDEEERRLFYVGITRAKNVLSIFTFQNKDGDYASFAAEVFPSLPKPKQQQSRTAERRSVPTRLTESTQRNVQSVHTQRSRAKTTSYGYTPKPTFDLQKIRDEIMQYHQNMRVQHKYFGRGVVRYINVSRNGIVAEIEFEEITPAKKIDLITAIGSGVLSRSP